MSNFHPSTVIYLINPVNGLPVITVVFSELWNVTPLQLCLLNLKKGRSIVPTFPGQFSHLNSLSGWIQLAVFLYHVTCSTLFPCSLKPRLHYTGVFNPVFAARNFFSSSRRILLAAASGSGNFGSDKNIDIWRTKDSQITWFSTRTNLESFKQREHSPMNFEIKLRAWDTKPLKKGLSIKCTGRWRLVSWYFVTRQCAQP